MDTIPVKVVTPQDEVKEVLSRGGNGLKQKWKPAQRVAASKIASRREQVYVAGERERRDRDTLNAEFITGGMLDGSPENRLTELNDSIDMAQAKSFLHLWDWDIQGQAVRTDCRAIM